MSYKSIVILALAIALLGHLVAAGRTLHDHAYDSDSRKLLQQYGTDIVLDQRGQTISGASDLIAQAVAAGAQPEATAVAATRGADYATLTTEDSLAGRSDTGARRLLQGPSVDKAPQTTTESSAVPAQPLVAGARPDVRSSALKAGADYLKLSTVDAQLLRKLNPDLVRRRSMLQRDAVVGSDEPSEARPVVSAESRSALAGVRPDVKSSSLKAGADYLKLTTLDPQLLAPQEDIGDRKRSLLQRSTNDEFYKVQQSLDAASDVIYKAVDSDAHAAVTNRAMGELLTMNG